MNLQDPGIADAALSMAAAGAGRLLLLGKIAREKVTLRAAFVTLAWEIPFTGAVALFGWAICEALGLGQAQSIVAIAVLGRYGPERLEALVDRIIPLPRNKGADE